MSRLNCLLDHGHELAGQVLEVYRVAQAGPERFQRLRRVVLPTVEAAIDKRLNAVPDGVEEGGDDQRRCHDRELGSLAGQGDPGPLQKGDAAEVQQREREGKSTVDEGAVYDHVYV